MILVSTRPLASHDTPFQNIKIIEIFWCQPGRTRRMTLIFKNVKRQLYELNILIKFYQELRDP